MEAGYKLKIEKLIEENTARLNDKDKEIIEYKNQREGYDAFMSEKSNMEAKIKQLIEEVAEEKKNKIFLVTEKEREKIHATEKLRKDMLVQIKKTKANLLALNDEQLKTTTRLTILQNHQLTTELEYQSKQTEDLLYKNTKMKS